MLAQRLLHSAHLLTFAALFASGVLLLWPELRSTLIGGYSLVVRALHCWVGIPFVALPALILAGSGRRALAAKPGAFALRTLWRRLHIGATMAMSVLFTLTGAVLWADPETLERINDGSRAAHNWLTWAAAGLVGLHLVEIVVSGVAERVAGVEIRRDPVR